MSLDRLVVGLDGSAGATHALEWCIDLAVDLEVEVLAVHALSPLAELGMALPPFDSDEWREHATEQFRDVWCQPLRDADVPHRTMVLDDYPVPALTHTAESRHADMIVVGAHGHGGLRDRVTGGVSLKLVQQADVPVVVVPPRSPTPPGTDTGGRPGWPAGSP